MKNHGEKKRFTTAENRIRVLHLTRSYGFRQYDGFFFFFFTSQLTNN